MIDREWQLPVLGRIANAWRLGCLKMRSWYRADREERLCQESIGKVSCKLNNSKTIYTKMGHSLHLLTFNALQQRNLRTLSILVKTFLQKSSSTYHCIYCLFLQLPYHLSSWVYCRKSSKAWPTPADSPFSILPSNSIRNI